MTSAAAKQTDVVSEIESALLSSAASSAVPGLEAAIHSNGVGTKTTLGPTNKTIELLNRTGMDDQIVAKSYKRETKHRLVLFSLRG